MIIDEATVRRNLKRMADYVAQHGLGLRPHTKTHKSVAMGRLQLEYGAIGLTVAKAGEAEVMAEAGDDVLVAYPALDPIRTGRIAELARRKTIRTAVDSTTAADAIASAAQAAGAIIGLLVDIDVGHHRTGLQSPQAALELAQHIDGLAGVRLDGLFCFPGHIMGPPDSQAAELTEVAAILDQTLSLWQAHGLQATIVSGGSTPTAFQSQLVAALTEIRPGTYIYNDGNCVAGGFCTLEDCAAQVVCTVISNAVPNKVVIDAGSKTLTSDLLFTDPHHAGYGHVVEYPQAKIVRLTEEHGEIDLTACQSRPDLGDRVSVIPNHICPCVNLQEHVYLRRTNGTLEPLPIDAQRRLN